MLTIFSIPKPFEGHNAVTQRNAVQSWLHLRPACEIILCGNDKGTDEVAREFGIQHLADVVCTEYGTPLLDSVFSRVCKIAQHNILCYVNTDIMLMSDLLDAIARIRFSHFLMSGRRRDVDITQPWNFESPSWETDLRHFVMKTGSLHSPDGMDYFVFVPDGAIEKLRPFAVGRAGWDNWFVGHARHVGFPVIDATRVVCAVHQNHDYHHVPNRHGDKYMGPESNRNLEMSEHYKHNLLDVTHIMTRRFVLPAVEPRHLNRRLLRFRTQIYLKRQRSGPAQ